MPHQHIIFKNLLCRYEFSGPTSWINYSWIEWSDESINKASTKNCEFMAKVSVFVLHKIISAELEKNLKKNPIKQVYLSFLSHQMHTIHQAVCHCCLSITLLAEWPVSFLNLFCLIGSLPVMLWKQRQNFFSPPTRQVAVTLYAKSTSRNAACLDAVLCF